MDINIDHIKKAAQAGGGVLRQYFGQTLDMIEKSMAADVKTRADVESEQAILEELHKHFPDFNIISEETGHIQKQSEYTFVIDPLDGTNNFVLGIPNFTVSIALFHNEVIVAGVVYQPVLNLLYAAQKGQGAFLNNQRLEVSKENDFSRSTIFYMCGYTNVAEYYLHTYRQLDTKNVKRLSVNWSPAFDFCMLASGKAEAIINNGTELYDFSAGKLIATEAGAQVTDFDGNAVASDKQARFLVTNGSSLHQQLLEALPKE